MKKKEKAKETNVLKDGGMKQRATGLKKEDGRMNKRQMDGWKREGKTRKMSLVRLGQEHQIKGKSKKKAIQLVRLGKEHQTKRKIVRGEKRERAPGLGKSITERERQPGKRREDEIVNSLPSISSLQVFLATYATFFTEQMLRPGTWANDCWQGRHGDEL